MTIVMPNESTAIGFARYSNQKLFCKNHKLPMFANRTCSHDVTWGYDEDYSNKSRDYWATHITDEQSMTEHIVSCPVCHKSFCD